MCSITTDKGTNPSKQPHATLLACLKQSKCCSKNSLIPLILLLFVARYVHTRDAMQQSMMQLNLMLRCCCPVSCEGLGVELGPSQRRLDG